VLERVGRRRGTRYFPSRRFYAVLGERGRYTHRRGLDRQANMELLCRHLADHAGSGCPMRELQEVLPGQSRDQIKRLLDELRQEGRVRLEGVRRWARWYPAVRPGPDGNEDADES